MTHSITLRILILTALALAGIVAYRSLSDGPREPAYLADGTSTPMRSESVEGFPTARVVDGYDANSITADALYVDYYSGTLKLRGGGSLPVEINHREYVLEVGESGATLVPKGGQ